MPVVDRPLAVRQVLPDLLRDLGGPFGAVWAHFQTAHADREAARLFAKVLGQIEAQGLEVVAAAAAAALATGGPLLLALTSPAIAPAPAIAVPPALRDIAVSSGCAADYDDWLAAVHA